MVKSVFGTKPAPYAHKAVKKCRQLGAKIAIATAETCPDFVKPQQKKFLSSLGIKETDQQFCDSCGYNTEKGKGVCLSKGCLWVENPYDKTHNRCITKPINGSLKRQMLENIIKNAKDKSKVIFFDDQLPNRKLAESLGIKSQSASDNCGNTVCDEGSGLTKKDFVSGMKKVDNRPEICIFDIDNTLTRGIKSKSGKEKGFPTLLIFGIVFVIILILTIILII